MHIQREGFVFRVASFADSQLCFYSEVNLYPLMMWFLLGMARIAIANVCTWIAVAVLGIGRAFAVTIYFLAGKKFIRTDVQYLKYASDDLIIGSSILERWGGSEMYYKAVHIEWMPTLYGFRIVPVYVLMVPLLSALLYGLCYSLVSFIVFIVLLATGPYPYLRMLVAMFGMGFVLGWLYRRFVVGSEVHTLFLAWIRARSDGLCPSVDIVGGSPPSSPEAPQDSLADV